MVISPDFLPETPPFLENVPRITLIITYFDVVHPYLNYEYLEDFFNYYPNPKFLYAFN